jgi:hypothetical protein
LLLLPLSSLPFLVWRTTTSRVIIINAISCTDLTVCFGLSWSVAYQSTTVLLALLKVLEYKGVPRTLFFPICKCESRIPVRKSWTFFVSGTASSSSKSSLCPSWWICT